MKLDLHVASAAHRLPLTAFCSVHALICLSACLVWQPKPEILRGDYSKCVRACLKKTIEARCSRFGVPPLGGFCAAPPKGGTPNRVFKKALRHRSTMSYDCTLRVTNMEIWRTRRPTRFIRNTLPLLRYLIKVDRSGGGKGYSTLSLL